MKKILIVLTVLLCQKAFAQNYTAEKLAISQVLIKQQTAWNNGNISSYMSYYWNNDSLQFIGKKGLIYGWQNTLNNYKKLYPDTASMGKLFFNILHLDIINKNCAYVVGKWNLIRNDEKGNLGGHFTLILKKINKKWVIVSDHSS
jgi:ketosteroid isomerase-like protein